ncbi:hypothetical protein OG921_01625 [Aldersonia sp. NBC_00410]|nr:hypothetical protein [Aldersonia sp. NBC_00410]MCX5041892.1 hypothetical protein [Aldersonia sp. NBC_00410]
MRNTSSFKQDTSNLSSGIIDIGPNLVALINGIFGSLTGTGTTPPPAP